MAKKSKIKRKITKTKITKKAVKAVKKAVKKCCRVASGKDKNSKIKKLIKIARMRVAQKQQSKGFFARLFNK